MATVTPPATLDDLSRAPGKPVAPLARTVTSYRGGAADAEPAVPGWRIPLADLFA